MIEKLQAEFGIPGAVTVAPGVNGLPKVVLAHRSGAGAEVYLHGAHLTSWTTAGSDKLLFVSREALYDPRKAIRGGIPVIFPQFGGGPIITHGFARVSEWELVQSEVRDSGEVFALLQLSTSDATLAIWPYHFSLSLGVSLSESRLAISLQVANVGDQPLQFTSALHTYFAVADIARTAVCGLAGTTFVDSLRENLREVESNEALRFVGETDRIYVDAPDCVALADEGHQRIITIEKCGMPDIVVWNPWIDKAQRLSDFGDDEYQRMVCVETGNMLHPFGLDPERKWEGVTTYTVE